MEAESPKTEIILTNPRRSLGKIQLDWMPQPGNRVDLQGETYAVLERHHHYQYRIGGYYLDKIALYVVQAGKNDGEKSFIDGMWVIGDADCRFNARSELLRCAVNPDGPCEGCHAFELRAEKLTDI